MKLLLALGAGVAVGAFAVRKLAQDPEVRAAAKDVKEQSKAVLADLKAEVAKAKDKAAETVKERSA